jgi:hypothetical protein
MGLFKPAWQSKNKKRALKAVEKLTDQTKLAKVATSATNTYVRHAAVKKLTDQNVLAAIAKRYVESETVRLTAIEKLTDQNILSEILNNEKESTGIRWGTVKAMTDQHAIARYLDNADSSDWFVNLAALERLTDQAIIADLLRSNRTRSESIRLDVVARLTNRSLAQEIYLDMAKNAADMGVRISAARKLDDQTPVRQSLQEACVDTLTSITIWDSDRYGAYFWMIKDQTAFADIALKAKHKSVRTEALKSLTDEKLIADVAKNADVVEIRELALKKVTDQSAIADIAKNDKEMDMRYYAAEMLADRSLAEKVYAGIVKDGQYSTKDSVFMEWAFKGLTDQTLLADVAENARTTTFSKWAAEKLTDPEVLSGYVKRVGYNIPVSVVGNISDRALLIDVMKKSGNNATRVEAMRRSGLLCDEGGHKWIAVHPCRQECTVCGVGRYNHDYVQTRYDGSGADVSYEECKCTRCGHTGYASGYGSTLEEGYYLKREA